MRGGVGRAGRNAQAQGARGVGVLVRVGVWVKVGVLVRVGVFVAVGVLVRVAVGVGVGPLTMPANSASEASVVRA